MQNNVPAGDDIAYRRELAMKEYFRISELIDNFDERSLKIKSWSVTVSAAAIGFSITQKAPILFLLAAFSSLIFWLLETMWKFYQHVLIIHYQDVEDYLSGKTTIYTGPSISANFNANVTWQNEKKKMPEIFWYRNVMLPHLLVVICGIIGFIASKIVL